MTLPVGDEIKTSDLWVANQQFTMGITNPLQSWRQVIPQKNENVEQNIGLKPLQKLYQYPFHSDSTCGWIGRGSCSLGNSNDRKVDK
jgi:hypothetical protein